MKRINLSRYILGLTEIYSQSENDDEMNKVYQVIYNCNVVIDEVMDSKNGQTRKIGNSG